MIVSDTGPIIAFSRIGRMDILRRLFGEIIIPNAVYEELAIAGKGRPGAVEVTQSSWIHSREVRNRESVNEFPLGLHKGELEAIALARENGMPLLIDERQGRRVAANIGVTVIGSLAVLANAHREGIIEDTASLVQDFLKSGYWINPDVIEAFFAN